MRRGAIACGCSRTGYGVKIALATAFAVLVMGYGLFVAVYLIATGHFVPFWSIETLGIGISALVNLILTAIVWVNVRGLVVRRNLARALAQRDPSVVSAASLQPDASFALPAGETLTIARRYSLNAVYHSLTGIVFYVYLLIVCENIIFQALPALGHSELNPYFHSEFDGPVAPPPTTLDWLAAGFPLLLATCVVGYLVLRDIRDRLHRIVADDTEPDYTRWLCGVAQSPGATSRCLRASWMAARQHQSATMCSGGARSR